MESLQRSTFVWAGVLLLALGATVVFLAIEDDRHADQSGLMLFAAAGPTIAGALLLWRGIQLRLAWEREQRSSDR